MKKNMTRYFLPVITAVGMLTMSSCTKLEPKLDAPNSIAPTQEGGAPTAPSIQAVYEQLNLMTGGQEGWHGLQEHTTDELLGPTRGTDWDDFGTWRRLHLHTWAPDHNQVTNFWNQLNGALFQTTLIAETKTGLEKAEGQFLRSYFRFLTCDVYGQVQTRPATAKASAIPDVLTRAAAIDAIIAELEAAVPALPAFNKTNRTLATKEAAWALLAKCYLNKAVYKQDPTKPNGPYTFAAADMTKVIEYCNNIAANSLLSINSYYWDNFTWQNGAKSTENIFVRINGSDARAGNGTNLVWPTAMGFHYGQAPSGWNGFATLSDFYDSFEATDKRRSDTLAGYTAQTGLVAGLLVGKVNGPKDGRIGNAIVTLKDRSKNDLVFTRNVSMFFNNEANGIRPNKFPLDPSTINDGGWGSANEFPFLRLADVRLMKAEATLRGGTGGGETALAIVNSIRSKRGASALTALTLPNLLQERGRELYLEGWRRNDMIRYGVFNDPVQERASASDGYRVVFCIPATAVASNPNLKQNFGY